MFSSLWHVLRQVSRRPGGMIGLAGLLVIVPMALIGPILPLGSPSRVSRNALLPPSMNHLMGTDHIGREILPQFVFGARVSITVGVVAGTIATIVGVLIGAAAGFWGGLRGDILMRITEFFQTMPKFFLMIIVASFLGSASLINVIVVIGLLSWPGIARITRSQFLTLKGREFVEATYAYGASDLYIFIRTILPNALPPIIISATLIVGHVILLEAYLSFLGIGDPSNPSWGLMLQNAQDFFFQSWWMSVFPGCGIFSTVLCLNLVGDALNEVLNPLYSRSTSVER